MNNYDCSHYYNNDVLCLLVLNSVIGTHRYILSCVGSMSENSFKFYIQIYFIYLFIHRQQICDNIELHA